MRFQKFRGIKRKIKNIQKWVDYNHNVDLVDLIKMNNGSFWEKFYIDPWFRISVRNSWIPQPPRQAKQLMVEGMVSIHDKWKEKLDQNGEPYSLSIRLDDGHDFIHSEIYVKMGEAGKNNNITSVDAKTVIQKLNLSGKLLPQLSRFNWFVDNIEAPYSDVDGFSAVDQIIEDGLSPQCRHRIVDGVYYIHLGKIYSGVLK